jgi:TniQ
MKFTKEAPEPLAFRVKPRPDEAFDSWIGRLTSSHEVSRAELYSHLDCDRRLASQDLARGILAVSSQNRSAFNRLIDQLAWSVQTGRDAIEATFVSAPEAALLPATSRHFGCAKCWQDALGRGQPLIIKREWNLRASWLCLRHHLPLVSRKMLDQCHTQRAKSRELKQQIDGAQRLFDRRRPKRVMLRHNQSMIDMLLGESDAGLPRGAMGYYDRFIANQFHLASARIAIFASAHSEMARSAQRFESMFSMSTPALVKQGKHGKPASKPYPRKRTAPLVPERLITVRTNNRLCDIFDMINAYAKVRLRPAPIQSSMSAKAAM